MHGDRPQVSGYLNTTRQERQTGLHALQHRVSGQGVQVQGDQRDRGQEVGRRRPQRVEGLLLDEHALNKKVTCVCVCLECENGVHNGQRWNVYEDV